MRSVAASKSACKTSKAPARTRVHAPPGRTVGLFWDLDNIPVLAPGSAVAIQIHRLKSAISMSADCITTFKAYGNKQTFTSLRKAGTLMQMEACGVEIIEASTFPESADTLLRSDAYFWGRKFRELGCIAIISGDTGFGPILAHLTSLGVYTITVAEHLPSRKYGNRLPAQAVLPKLLLPASARAAIIWSRKDARITRDELAVLQATNTTVKNSPSSEVALDESAASLKSGVTDTLESEEALKPAKAAPTSHPGHVASDWTNPLYC